MEKLYEFVKKVPILGAKTPDIKAEKEMLEMYMPIRANAYECNSCNSCGSGDCNSCCEAGDD